MKARAKYKGKYTKKRLINFVRGLDPVYDKSRSFKFQAVLWLNRGYITRNTMNQWLSYLPFTKNNIDRRPYTNSL